MQKKCIKINPIDNVAVLLEDGAANDTVVIDGITVALTENIEFGHKIALKSFDAEEPVLKYGEEIGYCLVPVEKGAWIHNHNMGCRRGK